MSTVTRRPSAHRVQSEPRPRLGRPSGSFQGGLPLQKHVSDRIDSIVVWEDDHHPEDEDDSIPEGDEGQATPPSPERPVADGTDLEKGRQPSREPGRKVSRTSTSKIPAAERAWKDDIVTFDTRDDPANPKNWTRGYKYKVLIMFGITTYCSSLASSILSSGSKFSRQFDISPEVTVLGTSLFLLGYVPGPIIFGPLSEIYGRKYSVLPPVFIFACFSAATATAANVQTIMITRFFAGVFASAPVTNVGGGISDMFDQRERASAVVLYSLAVVGGPTVGPVIGAAVSQAPSLGWRWTEYLVVIVTTVVVFFDFIFLPETFAPVILQKKAQRLRLETGRWALHSKLDEQAMSLKIVLEKVILRPVVMLVTEPILLCVTTYNAFTYGVLYLLFAAVPIVFEQGRGWNTLRGALPFLAITFGCFFSAGINILYSAKVYIKKVDASDGAIAPEWRLPPMMLGSLFFPIGFFLLGWTSKPSIQWFPSVLGLFFIGSAFLLIFQAGLNYIIDVYSEYAASAVAANTFMRSIFAAALPLVAMPLFNNLGVDWACTLVGLLAVLLAGIPYLFWTFGPRLRAGSRMMKIANESLLGYITVHQSFGSVPNIADAFTSTIGALLGSLPPMMLGSIAFPIGFFLLGWTSQTSTHWFPSVLGLFFVGLAFLLIFQGVYSEYAASAVAANTFQRSIIAAALPLVAQPLFSNLGIEWACSLLGFIAIVLAVIPYLFFIYGPKLRARSKMTNETKEA